MPIKMKTLADFKRAVKAHTKWETTHYFTRNGPESMNKGVREVVQVTTVAVGFTGYHGKPGPSWLYWPKAKECSFPAPDTMKVDAGFCVMTYKAV